ncbi:MAG: hypothetical protein AB7K41_05840 [Bdellovibrionales bacterium]
MQKIILSRFLIMTATGLILGAFFQNCGSYTAIKSGSPLVYKIDNGQTFTAQALSSDDRQAVCRGQHNWHCVIHQFRPDNTQSSTPGEVCNGDFCVDATLVHHGSAEALGSCRDCTEADGQPGGRYHYDEVYCGNQNITQEGSVTAAIVANSSIPQLALAEALNICLIAAE